MSERDALTDFLRRHDRPIAPAADFADRLEARLLTDLGPAAVVRPERRAEPIPVHARPRGVSGPMPGRRHRWMDVAAAAVLLMGVMGGMLSQLTDRETLGRLVPDPATIAAPNLLSTAAVDEAPVMEGGSPARDNRFAGPGPVEGELVERWEAPLVGNEFVWSSRPFEDVVFVVRGGGRAGATALEARQLSDGAVRWERESTTYDTTVTSDGVIVLESTSSTSPTLAPHDDRVLLLDRVTGAEIWRHELVGVSGWQYRSPVVVGDTVYVVDGDGSVSALDLVTGDELWASTAGRAAPTIEVVDCEAPAALCQYGSFAYEGGTLYLVNAAGKLHALDARTGDAVWSVDLVDRYGLARTAVSLLATGTGVVATMVETGRALPGGGFGPSGDQRTALLDRGTGAEVWTRDGVADGGEPTSDGTRLYLRVANLAGQDYPCCRILAIDLATGETVWDIDGAARYLLGLVGTDEPELVAVESGRDGMVDLVGLDPSTGAERRRTEVGQAYPTLPTATDGTIFATTFRHTFVAYTAVTTPAETQVAVMQGGSGARDNRFAGPGPVDGALVERWTASPIPEGGERYPLQVIPAGDRLYQLFPGRPDDTTDSRFVGTADTVTAHDLETGVLVWSRADLRVAGIAASAAGVVAILPAAGSAAGTPGAEAGVGSRMALLDAADGHEVWSVPLRDAGRDNAWSPILDDGTVYYAAADATIYAVDLATGVERWVSETGRESDDESQACLASGGPHCSLNSFALGDGLVYAVTSASTLIAVDAADGALRWEVDVVGRYGIPGDPILLPVAVPGGVMLGLGYTVDGKPGEVASRFVRLNAKDGAAVWERRVDGHPQAQVAIDGERAFLGVTVLPGGCCAILAIDLLTGEDVWRSGNTRVIPLGTTEGGDLYAVGTVTTGRQETFLNALDPATGEERWREQIPGSLTLPLAADGTMFVRNYDSLPEARLVAYRLAAAGTVATHAEEPAVATAPEEPAVMTSGSAARDKRWPGPGLTPGELRARWSVPFDDARKGEYVTSVQAFGGLVYVGIGDQFGRSRLEARRVSDGQIAWQRDHSFIPPVVTASGVLLVERDPMAPDPFAAHAGAVVLLDRTTGVQLWRYAVEGVAGVSYESPIVVGGTVYYADGETRVHALDLATGRGRWVSTAARVVPTADDLDCTATPPVCGYGSFAYADGVLYVLTAAGQVVAVDAADGAMRWGVDLGERYALKRNVVSLIATTRGVVASMTEYGPTASTGEMSPARAWRTSLLGRADGGEVWTRDDLADNGAVADGERVYVHGYGYLDGCCAIRALDLGTGETVWEIEGATGLLLGIVGGDDPTLVRLQRGESERESYLAALDPETGAERWRTPWGDVFPALPVADDGTVFVTDIDGGLVAYTVVAAASPVASPVALPMASPVASPAGSPVASAGATPVDGGPVEEAQADAFQPDHVLSAGGDVNLRSEPTTTAGTTTVIQAIPDGTPLRATGRTAPADGPDNGPWIEVELRDGTVGWVRAVDVSRVSG